MSEMEETDQPSGELEILRKLSSVVSAISEYCHFSGELKPNVLFYLLKLELLNDNSFNTFNEVEVIWTKSEDVYGKNQFGQESVVYKNRNTFPSELCDEQITGAGATDMKHVDGEISEEVIGESLNDGVVCKLEENNETVEDNPAENVATPIFVQNEVYEDIGQVAEQMQFTLEVQGNETYEYIQSEQAIESLEVDSPANMFSGRSHALQTLDLTSLSSGSKVINIENQANAEFQTEQETLNDEVQEKLTKSKQIVVNDRRLVPTYECPECAKKFSVAHHLKSHLLSHYKVKNLACNLCQKRFSEKSHLTRHAKLTHGVGLDKKYPCKVCRKEFPTVPRLVQHLKIHTGDARYTCDLCPARFPTATSLQWHKKAHTAALQFPCEVCGWVYKSKGVCQNHIKKYHPEVYVPVSAGGGKPPGGRAAEGRKSEQETEAERRRFSKLLSKLRQRNLIRENVGRRGEGGADDSDVSNNPEEAEADRSRAESEIEDGDIEQETDDLIKDKSQGQGHLLEGQITDVVGDTEGGEGQNEGSLTSEVKRSVKVEDTGKRRKGGRKTRVTSGLDGEKVPEVSTVKLEPVDNFEVDENMEVEKPESEKKKNMKGKGTKGRGGKLKRESKSRKDEIILPESVSPSPSLSLKKRGQKTAECGHFSVSWDNHQMCGMCRFKGKGTDPCVREEACDVCEDFTVEQKQYYSIRRRAFLKKREIGQTKALLKLKKPKKEAETTPDPEEGLMESGVTGADAGSLLPDDLSLTAEEVDATDQEAIPRLAEAHMDVKSYQRELESKYRWYKCLYCEKSFLHKTSLVNHMNSQHEQTEEILFPCTECHKVFATLAQLKRHFTTHGIGAVLTPCPECGRTFRDKSNLTKHRMIHLDVKLFTCEYCGKAFSNAGGLTIHRRTHTGIRPYQCRYCEKTFTNAGALRGHERVHTGEKPYVCDICGVCFRDRSHLNRHKKSHVQSDRVRPHRCGLCGKTFSAQVNLNRHLRAHSMKAEPVLGQNNTTESSSSPNRHLLKPVSVKTEPNDSPEYYISQ